MTVNMIDLSKCLHKKNLLDFTIGDYCGMIVGEERIHKGSGDRVVRLSWTKWWTEGKVKGLFESFNFKREKKK